MNKEKQEYLQSVRESVAKYMDTTPSWKLPTMKVVRSLVEDMCVAFAEEGYDAGRKSKGE